MATRRSTRLVAKNSPPELSGSDQEENDRVPQPGGTSTRNQLSESNTCTATVVKNYVKQTNDQLSLLIGDILVDVREVSNKLYKGKNNRTGQIGYFPPNHVRLNPERNEPPLITDTGNEFQAECDSGSETERNQTLVRSKGPEPKWIWIVAAFAVVLLTYFSYSGKKLTVAEMKTLFKSQDSKMWKMLEVALLPSKTELVQTFVFLHDNITTTECFIKKLSNDECSEYKAEELSLDEHFLHELKNKLARQKCIVILDLEKMPPKGVAVLKGLCDAYTPVVKNARFYFAVNAEDSLVPGEENKILRETLTSKWSTQLNSDEFVGTLARLSQNVMKVFKEDSLPCA